MTKDEALKLALEALNTTESDCGGRAWEREQEAITAIKEALMSVPDGAQPEPWEKFCDSNCVWTDHHPDCKMAQPEQKPVSKLQEATAERAWFTIAELNAWADKKLSENPHWVMPKDEPERDEPPPQRKPLRDHEIAKILDRERMKWHKSPPTYEFDLAFARAIEAAHGIKE